MVLPSTNHLQITNPHPPLDLAFMAVYTYATVVVKKYTYVTALVQILSLAFTAICCKMKYIYFAATAGIKYIYFAATAGIKYIHFCSTCCN
jgi:hypothetical protein